jgi:hypothetical protein
MPASIPASLRACCVLAALLAAGLALSGCASVSDTVAPAFADPGRYELWDCKQLETERKGLAARTAQLQALMDKAETGTGGAVVAELAYRNEYVAVRGQAHFAEDAWRRSRCRETPPAGAQASPAPSAPSPAAAAGLKSGNAIH